MAKQLTLILDTNILIPLQDSYLALSDSLASFHRLALVGGHQLVYHPASLVDFERDSDLQRRARNLQHVKRYPVLENPAKSPWSTALTGQNDACDNEILYALHCDAAHGLVTEDRGLLAKARARGLAGRTYTIQTAEDWLRRLHQPHDIFLPNIHDVPLHSLTPELSNTFFGSLREAYAPFDEWFRTKAREGRKAWTYRDEQSALSAICVYAMQSDERITDDGQQLAGKALKLCTFKVGESVRGRKIGELFLKAAFRYATENACEHVFIHADVDKHGYLVNLLVDFGFYDRGTYGKDQVFVKTHPQLAPPTNGIAPFDYFQRFYPHYLVDAPIRKFLVPIQSGFHQILFPDYQGTQTLLFQPDGNIGNAIKLAYLCHAPTKKIRSGDILAFYRTGDEQTVTSLGVVEQFEVMEDVAKIASLVRRRTVYSIEDIESMAMQPTKVILFRLVEHLSNPVSYRCLQAERIVTGPIQSITEISDVSFSRMLRAAGH